MSSAEAVEVVHQMMEAREQEEARTAALASQVATDPSAVRKRFWKEVAIYPLTLVCAAVYTLLMAVAQ